MRFSMNNFPKFKEAYIWSSNLLWEDDLHDAGYKSATNTVNELIEMDDIEYTHFVLKWL